MRDMVSTKVAQVSFGTAFAINTCIFSLKLFTRCRYLGGLKADDYLAIVAQLFFVVAVVNIFIMLGNDLESPEISWLFFPTDKVERLLKCFYISVQTYLFGLLFCKLSLIYLYKRITMRATTLSKINTYLNYLSAFCIIYTMAIFISILFWCEPLYAFWKAMPFPQNPRYCSTRMQKLSVYIWQGFNISTDVCILITPYFIISRAALVHRTQRLALFFLIALGILVIISSTVRAVGIARNFQPSSLVLWSYVEGCVALIVLSLPSLPPLIWRRKGRGSGVKHDEEQDMLQMELNRIGKRGTSSTDRQSNESVPQQVALKEGYVGRTRGMSSKQMV